MARSVSQSVAPFAVGERRRRRRRIRRCTISIQTIMMTGFRMDGRTRTDRDKTFTAGMA